jgi:hypothetical protein
VAGKFHTCGVRSNGTIACWGWDGEGQAPQVSVNPLTLPEGNLGVGYDFTLWAGGTQAPYTFTVLEGSLPPGLSLDTNGRLHGSPTKQGFFIFTVMATDANPDFPKTGTRAYTLAIGMSLFQHQIYFPIIFR